MRRKVRVVAIVLWTVALLGVPGRGHLAPEPKDAKPPRASGAQEVEVIAVVTDQTTGQPTVMLQGKRDRRLFSMAIDPAQMVAIAVPLQGITPPRPLTHDLFLTLFGRLKVTLVRAVITDLRDDVYYATVYLRAGGTELELDARPSDAIALAIRAKVPVLVEERVFDKGGGVDVRPRRPSI